MALVAVLAPRSCCGTYVRSGPRGLHEPCGHRDPCGSVSFCKRRGSSRHSRRGCRGHCDPRSRPNARGMSLCGRSHAHSLVRTVLRGLPPANIVRLYCAYSLQ